MRVVFDSNIYISALVFPGSQADQAFSRVLEGTDTLVLSKAILDEVLGILARKFSRDPEALSQTAVLMAEMGEIVKPVRTVDVFKDDPDNRVLECAEAGHAECIVTGDKVMLELKQYGSIRLIPLREYLSSKF
ncbi:MAG: putative toxin-antitoxin system toxin component, PIN family [Nitrospirota bacterium]|nr:putative toxin-antitoxin system toxin component, PIN family [Nitrospirota bacterium]MDH5585657.1 putative toxin-antitoxin system toxin component, PIN family [Nitrospirota bacterium]MDH5775887.1 putative toxin-antitoxin system toxin component, PIN family [Nitrospirota bacterium]